MILLFLAAATACASGPPLFCEAEQAEIDAERDLESILPAARAAAELERKAYREWSKRGQGSTLAVDEVEAFERSQAIWRESVEADCSLVAAQFRRAATSSVPITMDMQCRAERLHQRRMFLVKRYQLQADADETGHPHEGNTP